MPMNPFGARLGLGIALVMMAMLVGSCTKYSIVSRSDWGAPSGDPPRNWRITTGNAVYIAQSITTTDSTLVLAKATRSERLGKTIRSAGSDPRIEESGLPIVLPLDEVESVERGEFSRSRTAFAALGIAASTFAVAIVIFWMYAEGHGGLY